MTGIREMFAELADESRNHYEMQLELWCQAKQLKREECSRDWQQLPSSRAAGIQRAKQWRIANANHVRAYDRARRPSKRRVKTPDMCRDCFAPRVPGRASCADHLAKARARAARAA